MPQLVVMARVRPMLPSELDQGELACVAADGNSVHALDDNGSVKSKFPLDDLFWMDRDSQTQVYARSGALATEAVMRGHNACVFAYGQTGSGKTHTIMGSTADPGILPRTINDIFLTIECASTAGSHAKVYEVDACFFEVYNEQVRDLLSDSTKDAAPKIRKHPTRGVFIEGLRCETIRSASDAHALIEQGMRDRAMAATHMNARSSRSHAVFNISVTCTDGVKGTRWCSSAHIVDLAGSERLKQTGATGTQLEEAKNINQSLFTLRRVLDTLAANAEAKKRGQKPGLVPYRDSVLTHILSDSLGGKSYCLMLATLSPHPNSYDDTLNTLKYAARARQIVLKPKVNEQQDSAALQKAMQAEIVELRRQLTISNRDLDSEDIEMEISLRQDEVERMQNTDTSVSKLLAEYRERDERMSHELAEVEKEKQQMQEQLKAQKQERFAEAFRNAFRISRQRAKSRSASTHTPPSDIISWAPSHHTDPAMQAEISELRAANANLQHSVFQLIDQLCAAKGNKSDNDEPRLTPAKSRKHVDLEAIVEEQQCDIRDLQDENAALRQQLLESRELQQEMMSQLWILQRQRDRSTSPRLSETQAPDSRGSSTWTVSETNASSHPVPRLPLSRR